MIKMINRVVIKKRIPGYKMVGLFFLTMMTQSLFAQTDSLKTLSLVEKLRLSKRVESKYVGYSGSPSSIYQTAEALWKESSVVTLTKLTQDNSAVVRCYAFLGLLEKNTDQAIIKGIVEDHRKDTAKVATMNGCVVWSGTTVVEYMMLHAGNYK